MADDDPETRLPTGRQSCGNNTMNTPKKSGAQQALRRTDTFDKFHVSKDSKKYHDCPKVQTRRDQIITKHLKTMSSGAGPYPSGTDPSRLTTEQPKASYMPSHRRGISIEMIKNKEPKPILRTGNSTYRRQQTETLDNPFFPNNKSNFRAETQNFDDQQTSPGKDSRGSPTKIRRMGTFGELRVKIDTGHNEATDESEEDEMWSPLMKALEYKRSQSLKNLTSPMKSAIATLVKTHRSPKERGSLFVSKSQGEIK